MQARAARVGVVRQNLDQGRIQAETSLPDQARDHDGGEALVRRSQVEGRVQPVGPSRLAVSLAEGAAPQRSAGRVPDKNRAGELIPLGRPAHASFDLQGERFSGHRPGRTRAIIRAGDREAAEVEQPARIVAVVAGADPANARLAAARLQADPKLAGGRLGQRSDLGDIDAAAGRGDRFGEALEIVLRPPSAARVREPVPPEDGSGLTACGRIEQGGDLGRQVLGGAILGPGRKVGPAGGQGCAAGQQAAARGV